MHKIFDISIQKKTLMKEADISYMVFITCTHLCPVDTLFTPSADTRTDTQPNTVRNNLNDTCIHGKYLYLNNVINLFATCLNVSTIRPEANVK